MDILENTARRELHQELRSAGLAVPVGEPRNISSSVDTLRGDTREKAVKSLYFFTTAVFGWNKLQKEPHLEMCRFLETTQRGVMLVPRDCYKSTIASKSAPIWI